MERTEAKHAAAVALLCAAIALIYGRAPGAQHLENVAIHAVTSALVYAIAVRALRNGAAALLVALLFAVHPLHVESVAWISERKDLLCGLFYALAVLAHLHYAERPSAGRYAAVLTAFALALLAKPMAVTLPVALWLLDDWPLQRWRTRRALLEKLPLFALSLGAALVTIAAQSAAIARLERLPL